MKCKYCHGCGYQESAAYYYGRAECSFCGGIGIVNDAGEPFEDEHELEAHLARPLEIVDELFEKEFGK